MILSVAASTADVATWLLEKREKTSVSPFTVVTYPERPLTCVIVPVFARTLSAAREPFSLTPRVPSTLMTGRESMKERAWGP